MIVMIGCLWVVDAYPSRYFPFFIVKRTVARKPLMPSDFTRTKSLGSASAKQAIRWIFKGTSTLDPL